MQKFQEGGAEGQKKMVYLLSLITLCIYAGLAVNFIIYGFSIVTALLNYIGSALLPLFAFFICTRDELKMKYAANKMAMLIIPIIWAVYTGW